MAHSTVAFLSALVIPLPLTVAFWLAAGVDFDINQIASLGATSTIGCIIAAVAVYRHKAIPPWLAGMVGLAVVLVLMVAPSIWALMLS